jgi:4-hydroxybenzoate polyprenyltransferase
MKTLRAAIRLIRPEQWIKNLFLFGPLIFARDLFVPELLMSTVRGFFAFSFTASAVYILNDLADREADRTHPKKRNRPLAAGTITVPQALVLFVTLLAGAVLLALGLPPMFGVVMAAYFAMNLAYSWKLKEVVLLDVFVIATGFMLRVLAGAYAIDVPVSGWILLCTLFIALFLGFAKRRSELVQHAESGRVSERKVLQLYSVDFIDQMLTIAAAGTVICYALYTVAPRTVEVFGTDKLIYTTIFVVYGILRYLYLIHMTDSTESPTAAVTHDGPIIATVVLWVGACILFIYWSMQAGVGNTLP